MPQPLPRHTVHVVVTPRERGRYQGIFGAAFGAASIAGPLLGGYLTSHISWRAIFSINIPFGMIAIGVIGAGLPARAERRLFRLIGGSFGTALFGTIFAAGLAANQTRVPRPQAYAASLDVVFLVASGIASFGFLLAWILPEQRLRETISAASAGEVGHVFAMPQASDSLAYVMRGLATLANRRERIKLLENIVQRAEVDLSARG